MATINVTINRAVTGTRISSFAAGTLFNFVSTKKQENTATYIKLNSRENKAMNLTTWKIVKFSATEVGTEVAGNVTGTVTSRNARISGIEDGGMFHFTSASRPANTGAYLKIRSSEAIKALNLTTFKVVTFSATETGYLVDGQLA